MVRAETLNEVLADKLLAFPICTKVIRHRDIWDIAWILQQRNTALNMDLLKLKISDYHVSLDDYLQEVRSKINTLSEIVNGSEFRSQMMRFIAKDIVESTIDRDGFNDYLIKTVSTFVQIIIDTYKGFPSKLGQLVISRDRLYFGGCFVFSSAYHTKLSA